jgi:predicted DsbA family dithiol-disulfide isomerase
MSCLLFSDFNCPFCYAMHERLHDLGLMAQVSWHGVQHARHLPVPMQAWSAHLASELKQEVEMVRRLAPELPIALPLGKPNSGPAIAAAARALIIDRLLAQEFIRSLYQMFWVDGKDLSNQELLQDRAERQGLPPAQICGKTALPIDDQLRVWEARWNETEHPGVPLVQRSDGAQLVGLVSASSIERFFTEASRL